MPSNPRPCCFKNRHAHKETWEVPNGVGVDGVGVNFHFFFLFLRFSSFEENLVFSAHLHAVAVEGPSFFSHGEN